MKVMEIKEVKEGKEIKEGKEVKEDKEVKDGKADKIDWKRKLTSRKFWVAIIGFITAIMVAFNVDKLTVEQVVAIVSALGTLVAYIIGEGMTDAAHIKEGK